MTILGKILNRKSAVWSLVLFLMLSTFLGSGLGQAKADSGPVLLSAVASYGNPGGVIVGIYSYVTLTFSAPADVIYDGNTGWDTVLTLSNGHSWFAPGDVADHGEYPVGNNVIVLLHTTSNGSPTISVGDTITVNNSNLPNEVLDSNDDSGTEGSGSVILTGSFAAPSSSSSSNLSSKPKIKPGKTYIYTATYKTKTVFSSDQVKQAVKNAFYANSMNHQLWFNSITITANTIKANFTSRLKVKVKRSTVKALLKLAPAKAIPAIPANQLKIKKSSL